jgi:two-component system nitrate/nitrite response regulator NarL
LVLLASTSPSLCRRWREALAGTRPLHQVADREGLMLSLWEHKPKVVFIDHSNKCFSTAGLLYRIMQTAPSSRFVVLTPKPVTNEAVAFIKAGARGYDDIAIDATHLRKAVQVVSRGEIWIARKHVDALIKELVDSIDKPARGLKSAHYLASPNTLAALSRRQREVASLVGLGQPNKDISNNLHISEKTVKAHLTIIFRKLHIGGRTKLALAVKRDIDAQSRSPRINYTKAALCTLLTLEGPVLYLLSDIAFR